jgi:hypothetical protein
MFAVLVMMWVIGKRLGPPEQEGRALPPPRRVYVESLAGAILRTKDRGVALAGLQAAASRRAAWRFGLGDRPDPSALRRAVEQAGLDAEERDALFGPIGSDEEVVALGRAMARLKGGL